MNQVIILAAGRGTRMNSDLPKVLQPLQGRPMITYLIESVIKSQICPRPIIIVSPDNQAIIKEALSKYNLDYAVQAEPLGTGQAVACAQELLTKSDIRNLVVFYGDHPFIQPETMEKLIVNHYDPITMMTTQVNNFTGWYQNFSHWGRIIRSQGEIQEIVEFKDATPEQQAIKEVNPALFCFNNSWLWENIIHLKNNNKQKEYYLTDIIKIATSQKIRINSLVIDPQEAIGINSPEELAVAEELLNRTQPTF
jgi:bifunctional UDP-N-acetylglucosamine pyrophosphorylase/glucosamine-1-phosphate N-acetyltransferase